jgi:HrpA-like RNA helicase
MHYMTAGVLIRRLIVDPDLRGVTHVILDEVHERSIEVRHSAAVVHEIPA